MTQWGRANNGPEVHHLAPQEVRDHEVIVRLSNANIWNHQSAIYNKIALPTDPDVVVFTGVASHRTSHPHYTNWYREQLSEISDANPGDLEGAKRDIIGLNNYVKALLLDPDRSAGLRNDDFGTEAFWAEHTLDDIRQTREFQMGEAGTPLRVLADQNDQSRFADDDPYNGISNYSSEDRRNDLRASVETDANRALLVARSTSVDDLSLSTRSEAINAARIGDITVTEATDFLNGTIKVLKIAGYSLLSPAVAVLMLGVTAEVADAKGSMAVDLASLSLVAYGLHEDGILEDASISGLITMVRNSNISGLIGEALDNITEEAAVDVALSVAASALGIGLLWNGAQILQSLSLLDTALTYAVGAGDGEDDALDGLVAKIAAVKGLFGYGPNGDVSNVDISSIPPIPTNDIIAFIYTNFSDQEVNAIRDGLFEAMTTNGVGVYGTILVRPSLDDMIEDLAGSNVPGATIQDKLEFVFDQQQMQDNPTLFALTNPNECFPAGTMIRMWYGSEKVIEAVAASDLVLSFDENGLAVPGRVSRVFRNTTPEWVALSDEGGKVFMHVTPGHRFLTESGDYMEIGHMLRLGGGAARIVREDGSLMTVQGHFVAHSSATAHLFEEARVALGDSS